MSRKSNDERKKRRVRELSDNHEELGSNKKARLDGSGVSAEHLSSSEGAGATGCCADGDDSMFPFHKFRTNRVLFTDPRSKSICVLGSCENGAGAELERGIVVAEKQPLTECSLVQLFSPTLMEKKFQNDVYSQYVLNYKEGGLGEVRVTTVYPATDKHVQKYEAQKRRFVLETPASYRQITKPFAEKQSLSLDVRTYVRWQVTKCHRCWLIALSVTSLYLLAKEFSLNPFTSTDIQLTPLTVRGRCIK